MDKLILSERDICTKFITPAIQPAEWQQHEFRDEVQLTGGCVMVRGNLAAQLMLFHPGYFELLQQETKL